MPSVSTHRLSDETRGALLYAYFVTLGQAWLESMIDVLFLLSYILVSPATLKQRELVAS